MTLYIYSRTITGIVLCMNNLATDYA